MVVVLLRILRKAKGQRQVVLRVLPGQREMREQQRVVVANPVASLPPANLLMKGMLSPHV